MTHLTPIKPSDMGGDQEFMALPGKVIHQIIANFCQKPSKKDPPQVMDSIGIGHSSLVATDTQKAICAGEPELTYVVTDRRCATLEADRADIYAEGFDANRVLPVEGAEDPANAPPSGDYPGIGRILDQLDGMKLIGRISPEALKRVAAVAMAANTGEVELYMSKSKDQPLLGFRFVHHNDSPQFGDALEVPFCGLLAARKGKKSEEDEE